MLNHLGVWSGLAGLAVSLIFGVGRQMGFRMPTWLARAGFVTGILLLAASPLIFLFSEEEPKAAATNPISNQGNNNCIVEGANNQVTCGVAGPITATPLPPPTLAFKEAASAYLFSLSCMNFKPSGGLLSGIESGKPTPFITMKYEDGTLVPLISPYATDGKFYVDVTLFSPVTGEAFKLRKDTFSRLMPTWDVNFNDRAIEVVDQNGTAIFQLIRKSDSILEIAGLIRTKNAVWFLGQNGTYASALIGEQANKYVPPPDFLPKLFKYPSWKYPGIYAASENQRPPCSPGSKQSLFNVSRGLFVRAPGSQ